MDFYRFNSILYTSEGKELIEKVWQETMGELSFADVRGIVSSMNV